MAVLREIVAKFRLGFDKRGFNEADKRLGGLSNRVRGMLPSVQALGIAFAAAGFGVLKFVNAASDAQEATNVMNAAFEGNRQQVEDWAIGFADATGRSRFAMREMAGNLGAMLNPLMEKNAVAAAEMSAGLTELSVDLASFFNTTDDKALIALRAGIVGETEPMRKFGVVILDATLQSFALAQGITKSFKAMSVAEKTALRYNFILDQTTLAQGDAARTADSWENASKGVGGAMKDLAVTVGRKLLPFAEKLAIGVRDLTRSFEIWASNSKIIEAALIVLGIIAATVAIMMIIAWAPVIAVFLATAVGLGLLALALDDFLVFMSGGDSVIGRFIESLFGPGSAEEASRFLKEMWESLKIVGDVLLAVLKGLGEVGVDAFQSLAEAMGISTGEMEGFGDTIKAIFGAIGDAISDAIESLLKFMTLKDEAKKLAFDFVEATQGTLVTAQASIGGVPQGPNVAANGRGGGGGSTTNTTSNQVNVDARGATAKDANRIGGVTAGALNRRTGAATTQVGS